jgi:hypothetical protein
VRVKVDEAKQAHEAHEALEKRAGIRIKFSDWLRQAIKDRIGLDLGAR